MVHEVKAGLATRQSFSKIKEVLEVPDLIEIQKDSYERFLREGLKEVLSDISPITDYSETLVLEFVDYRILETPKYDVEECKERDVNYAAPLKVSVRLINKETGEVNVQEVFMGDFPLMTERGTFIINGAERVIVSQLVRSPGVYFDTAKDKTGKDLFSSTVIPNRGAWLEFETDSNDIMWVRADRTRKLPATVLVRAMGLGSDEEIRAFFGEDEVLEATFRKDTAASQEDGLLEIYRRLRPGEPPTVESASQLVQSLFFDPKRYDLARVGRYKFNKKLSLAHRIAGQTAAENIINAETGEALVMAGESISPEMARQIQNAGINCVKLAMGEETVTVIGNHFVDAAAYLPFDPLLAELNEQVYYPALKEILEENLGEEELKARLISAHNTLIPKHIMVEDMFATFSYMLGLRFGLGETDDIDHLGNRRVRSVGELLQNQLRVGLSRLERVVRERM
ncbi:MAG: DNA-directed RNA polymerase subunit beta, partial [Clostridiales bacterium]|nr:DNA-directed RNA polymerase subunit beta [Clostridiales bacterium]